MRIGRGAVAIPDGEGNDMRLRDCVAIKGSAWQRAAEKPDDRHAVCKKRTTPAPRLTQFFAPLIDGVSNEGGEAPDEDAGVGGDGDQMTPLR